MSDDTESFRAKVAEAHGIDLYKSYEEKVVPPILGADITTVKRWRRDGDIDCTKRGPKKVYYLGSQLVDFIMGKRKPREGPAKPAE